MTSQLKNVDAQTAARLGNDGALMVDVREAAEFATTRIPGSTNVPLSGLETSDIATDNGQAIVYFCASGNRTNVHAARLAAKAGDSDTFVMDGGLMAWRKAGLPTENGSGESSTGSGHGLLQRIFGSSTGGGTSS